MRANLSQELMALRLPAMAYAIERWLADPDNVGGSPLDLVERMVAAQVQKTEAARASNFRRRAAVQDQMTVGNFAPSLQRGLPVAQFKDLVKLAWLDARQTVVISGPSQVGKTHLAVGLTQEAIQAGKSVQFVKVPTFLPKLDGFPTAKARDAYLGRIARADLLVLDDFATDYASSDQTAWFRDLVERRDSRPGGMIITALQNDPEEWARFFDNRASAAGLIGRIQARSIQVKLKARPPTR